MPDTHTLTASLYLAMGDAKTKQALPPAPNSIPGVGVWRIGPTHTPASHVDQWVELGLAELWSSDGRFALTVTAKGRRAIEDVMTKEESDGAA